MEMDERGRGIGLGKLEGERILKRRSFFLGIFFGGFQCLGVKKMIAPFFLGGWIEKSRCEC